MSRGRPAVYPSDDGPDIWVEAKTIDAAQVLVDDWTRSEGLDPAVMIGLERGVFLGCESVAAHYRTYWHRADAWHFRIGSARAKGAPQ